MTFRVCKSSCLCAEFHAGAKVLTRKLIWPKSALMLEQLTKFALITLLHLFVLRYVNHAFYFAIMGPNPNKEERFPSRITAQYIDTSFGNFSKFKEIFVKEATQLFGSGYVWLCREPKKDYFTIISTLNQQSPVSFGLEPVLVLDVWEHAYYLKHQNKRAGYIKDWWNIVDWKKVEKLLIWWKWQSERQHIEL